MVSFEKDNGFIIKEHYDIEKVRIIPSFRDISNVLDTFTQHPNFVKSIIFH